MTRSQRILLILIQIAFIITAALFLIRLFVDPEYHKIGGVIASFSLPFLPNVLQRLSGLKISFRLQLIYFIFLFVSLTLGICFDWYKFIPHFDKVIHVISGALSTIPAWYALKFFKADKISRLFQAIFIICSCMTIALIWEFFEFACDKILGTNMQQLISEGVDDTMFDLLSALIGTCLGTIFLMRNTKAIEKFSTAKRQKYD